MNNMETIEQTTETDYERFERLLELKMNFRTMIHTGNYEEKKILPKYIRQINIVLDQLNPETKNNYFLQYAIKSVNERRRICG